MTGDKATQTQIDYLTEHWAKDGYTTGDTFAESYETVIPKLDARTLKGGVARFLSRQSRTDASDLHVALWQQRTITGLHAPTGDRLETGGEA